MLGVGGTAHAVTGRGGRRREGTGSDREFGRRRRGTGSDREWWEAEERHR